MPQPTERPDRILDAAGELMIRLGYRKVTIEDIARQAGIGKGTVYLHWRTKEQLFESLFLRESVAMITELVDGVRRDPEEVRPHRFMRASFLATQRRPLTRALVTGDAELLGNLKRSTARNRGQEFTERYFELITKYGLVRDDVPDLTFSLNAVASGFFLVDKLNPNMAALDDQSKADALGRTLRRAFEPDHGPDRASLTAAAAEISSLFDEINTNYREWIYTSGAKSERT
ncbi:TetR/AcrR family transcriptional regulator [Saccharopolyspora phatthalungensis]|uniref:AcrR family transcriptional regulator n=1 Tax=Saccharopolyspora phatthalungensis TaxID=664693 RepID=A0A840PUY8_9PSEU|nr:TetR/AcrR family transcriptional regulator [Saccharopolyspora phatthalungensis]MBB5154102.1 AcrR family transcriptional regulator [Saccharopolyspora phatthalungensis]